VTKSNPARKESGHGFPQFLPDGKRFLYFVQSTDAEVQGVYASSLDAPELRQQILRTASKAFYAPPRGGHGGYLLWLQGQTLLAQRFDADRLRLNGEPVAIAENIALGQLGPVRAAYWVSDAGLLVYFGGAELDQRRIVWMGETAGRSATPSLRIGLGVSRCRPTASGPSSTARWWRLVARPPNRTCGCGPSTRNS
jgi:hypothetical protein